jgi:eukaryotic-like serine/threonine-protein kinase
MERGGSSSVSPDGKRLVFQSLSGLMNLSIEGDRPSAPLEPSIQGQANPAVSPDGRWLAYDVVRSGRREVYVRPFADPDAGRWQVSTDGGSHPVWAPNGTELFYLSSTAMMRIDVARSASWAGGRPVKQFDSDFFRGQRANGRIFDISPDGQRFLAITKPGSESQDLPIVLVQNWFEELKRLGLSEGANKAARGGVIRDFP